LAAGKAGYLRSVLTIGVEEEFLLVDPGSAGTVPLAVEVLAGVASRPDTDFHAELQATQVEAASGPYHTLERVRAGLAGARSALAAAARTHGVRLISAGAPVHGGAAVITPGERFDRVARIYAGVVADYQTCACQVHIGLPDRETAVAVLNHLRPWLPTLLALSANSPFTRGRDTGYASWRMVEQSRFPGSGVPPRFASAADYDRELARLVECGTLVDDRQTFWLARPSPQVPTIEVRAADAVIGVDEAVLQAALSRALVRTALAELDRGREGPCLDDQVVAAAVWAASRYGLAGPAVHPRLQRQVPAADLAGELLELVTPALADAGDLAFARGALEVVLADGTGAERQRRAATAGGTRAVINLLTCPE
jgi:glutamate---cysteine ligase / carboxylate-amine ligase